MIMKIMKEYFTKNVPDARSGIRKNSSRVQVVSTGSQVRIRNTVLVTFSPLFTSLPAACLTFNLSNFQRPRGTGDAQCLYQSGSTFRRWQYAESLH
jgi:hypothetical protein